jgi:DNA-binding transcriptional MerR regulator
MSLVQSETLSIGEVVARLRPACEVSESNLRFWEKQGLLQPQRTPGGHRAYSEADLERIKMIKALQEQRRLPLAAIRHLCKMQVENADQVTSWVESLLRPLHFEAGYEPRNAAALVAETGLSREAIAELTAMGVLRPTPGSTPDDPCYDEDGRALCRMMAELQRLGLPQSGMVAKAQMVDRHVRAEWDEIIEPNFPALAALPFDSRLRMKQVGEEMETLLFSIARRRLRDEIWQRAEGGSLPCQNEDH